MAYRKIILICEKCENITVLEIDDKKKQKIKCNFCGAKLIEKDE